MTEQKSEPLSTQLRVAHLKASLDKATSALNEFTKLAEGSEELREWATNQIASYALSIRASKLNKDELENFFKYPYCIIAGRHEGECYLAIPKFIDAHFGWLHKVTSSYNIFLVNQYVDWLGELPMALKKEMKFPDPLDVHLDGSYLVGSDVQKVLQKYPQYATKQKDGRILVDKTRHFEMLAALIKDGILPFIPKPVREDDLLNLPVEFELRDYQKEAWKEFLKYSNIGVFFPPSTGKTWLGMWALSHLYGPHVVAVPTRLLIEQWIDRIELYTKLKVTNDFKKDGFDVYVGTYQSVVKSKRHYKLKMIDECLHYDSEIILANGKPEKIGPIVNGKKEVSVLSYNFLNKKWENKPVINWIKNKLDDDLLQISFTERFSKLTCTKNHPLYCLERGGWVRADNLKEGEHVLSRPKIQTRWRMPKCLGSLQWQILFGCVLGDASLASYYKKARIRLVHGKKQLEYLKHKLRIFDSMLFSKPKHELTEFSPKDGVYVSTSASSVELLLVPNQDDELVSCLTRYGLAYWYMDDGSLTRDTAILHVQGRNYNMAKKMSSILNNKFSFKTKALLTKKGPTISFGRESTRILCNLIKDIVIPTMQYKLLPEFRGYDRRLVTKPFPFSLTRIEKIKKVKPWGHRKSSVNFSYCIDVKDNENFVAGNVLVHNCQHLPANEFSKLATIDSEYCIGLSATPMREDSREEFIFALSGKPVGLAWETFKQLGIIQNPSMHVWIVKNEIERIRQVESLLQIQMKTIIFCDSIEMGKTISKRFDLPHIHGQSKERLSLIQDALVSVVSRVGDEGVSLSDIKRIVEVSWLGNSRRQELQRFTRLLHGRGNEGEAHLIMTGTEYQDDHKRLFGLMDKGFKIVLHRQGEQDKTFAGIAREDSKIFAKSKRIQISKPKQIEKEPVEFEAHHPILQLAGVKKLAATLRIQERKAVDAFYRMPEKAFKSRIVCRMIGYKVQKDSNIRFGQLVKLGFIKKTKEGYQASPESLGG